MAARPARRWLGLRDRPIDAGLVGPAYAWNGRVSEADWAALLAEGGSLAMAAPSFRRPHYHSFIRVSPYKI